MAAIPKQMFLNVSPLSDGLLRLFSWIGGFFTGLC